MQDDEQIKECSYCFDKFRCSVDSNLTACEKHRFWSGEMQCFMGTVPEGWTLTGTNTIDRLKPITVEPARATPDFALSGDRLRLVPSPIYVAPDELERLERLGLITYQQQLISRQAVPVLTGLAHKLDLIEQTVENLVSQVGELEAFVAR